MMWIASPTRQRGLQFPALARRASMPAGLSGNPYQGGSTAMRYLLFLLGLAGLAAGALCVGHGHPSEMPVASALLVAGAVLFGLGGATIDIVEAIKNQPR